MSKKKTMWLIVILVAICLVIGVSYALWQRTLSQTDTNRITADCFEITLTNEKDMISLENAFPLYDEEGMELTPYTFTIQNKCASYASYNINLELLDTVAEDSRLDPQYLKVVLDENTPTILSSNSSVEPTLSNAYASYELTTGYLEQNEEKTYNLRLWLDENVTLEDPVVGKSIIAKITVTANYIDHIPTDYDKCVSEYGEDSLQCNIIANVDTTGACPNVNEDGLVEINRGLDNQSYTEEEAYNVIVSLTERIGNYICSAPDDYGTSYYYRGNVDNNYVKFAGFYWRIIRLNGDGSIRMIYAGDADVIDSLDNREEVLANGYNDADTDLKHIGLSAYNLSSDDNAYVGYMYGTTGSSTYEETHANINNSAIKTYIDNWYETHLKDTEYENYIADSLFCNDRSRPFDNDIEWMGDIYTNLGYSKENTAYRMAGEPAFSIIGRVPGYEDYLHIIELAKQDLLPTIKCANQNDRFTVNDTQLGNGELTYPIALIAMDEVYLAGGYTVENYSFYLYTGEWYWTMTPNHFWDETAFVRNVDASGNTYYLSNFNAVNSLAVRPVINLKPNSLKLGSGTVLDPYRVE